MSDEVPQNDSHASSELGGEHLTSRRDLLKGAAALGITAVGAKVPAIGRVGALPARAARSTGTNSGSPKHGGTLRYGGTGGTNTDTLDAQNGLNQQDFSRIPLLYEPLVLIGATGKLEYVLAESITPNANATKWTIKVRPHVVTHAGKPFGARDVLFSFTRILKLKYPGASSLGPINLAKSKVVNPLTLVVQFDKPFGLFLTFLENFLFLYMVPEGYDPKHPIGTGPFKLKSFTPGVSSTLVRNSHYWQSGLPYLDAVVSTNVAEETTQIDGLQSGQFDAISYLSAASSAALKNRSGFEVVISDTGGFLPFTIRVDKAPFSDVRVRQALRLVVDRPQMLREVFGGYGRIGNDMFGVFDPAFSHGFPQREQDIPRAKSLLKAAGHPNLSVQLITSSLTGGVTQAAEVFATQAAAAGVKVAVSQQDLTTYYANSFLKVPFSQDNWEYAPYLLAAAQETVPSAPFNECHFSDREYNALYAKAYASTDPVVQRDVVHAMQKIDYDYGGLIIPFFNPNIDAVASYVKGDIPNVTGFGLNAFDLRRFWLDK